MMKPSSEPVAPGANTAITVAGVSKDFQLRGGPLFPVLKDIRLQVPQGEIVAVLGSSGCGKSTLLNIISGLVPPSAGEIYFGLQPARDFTAWTSIGYVFQEDRLLPWRTAQRNVEFSLEAGRLPRSERSARADEALKLLGLLDFKQAYPYQLSGGMRSRVALARALVTHPTILLMDEPFSRLDAQTRAAMHDHLLHLWSLLRMSIVFVTHDVEESVVLADRVVVLSARPGHVQTTVSIAVSRPREPTAPEVSSYVQMLRASIGRVH